MEDTPRAVAVGLGRQRWGGEEQRCSRRGADSGQPWAWGPPTDEAVCLEGPGQQGIGISHGQNPSGSPPIGTEAEKNPIASHSMETGFLIL